MGKENYRSLHTESCALKQA